MTWRGKKETKIKPSLFELTSSCQRGCMKVFKVRELFIKDTDGADNRMQTIKKKKSGFPRFWGGTTCTTTRGHAAHLLVT